MYARNPFTFLMKSQLSVDGMCPAGYNEAVIKLGFGTFTNRRLIETRYMNPKSNPQIGWRWMLLNTHFETAMGCTRLFDLPVEREFLDSCIGELRLCIAELDKSTSAKRVSTAHEKKLADAHVYAAQARDLAQKHKTSGHELYAWAAELGLLAMRKVNQAIYNDTASHLARAWAEKLITWRLQNRCTPSVWVRNTYQD